jgi:hypothetical protein
MRRLAVFALAAAACGILAGCAREQGRVYQKSPVEAHRILAATGLPPHVFGTEEPEFSTDSADPAKVTWIVRSRGVEILRFAAIIAPASDAAVRVRVTVDAPKQGPLGDIAKRLDGNPTVKNLYLAAMEERVASALEGRLFKLASVYPEMMQAAFANLGRLQASVDAVHAESQKRARDNIDKAYEDEAAGRRN